MSFPWRVFLPSAIVLALLAACGQPQPPAQQTAARNLPTPAVRDYMKDHFTKVAVVRDAVIRDDPKGAQEAANWIVEQQNVEGLPGDWRPYVETMKKSARDALNAVDVGQAGAAVGTMGRACGDCHAAVRANIAPPPVGASPTDLSGVPAHMKRHQWAVEQMWVGLVYPSPDAWRRGSDSLAFAALRPEDLSKDKVMAGKVGVLALEIHTIGGQGASAQDAAARAQVYGRLISACMDCHRQLRKPITAPTNGM